jgi:hypothetical protein
MSWADFEDAPAGAASPRAVERGERMALLQDGDWRLHDQARYLHGATLHRARRRPPAPDSCSDGHCEFCWEPVAGGDRLDPAAEAYATHRGDRWVCSRCFEDFKGLFAWVVANSA